MSGNKKKSIMDIQKEYEKKTEQNDASLLLVEAIKNKNPYFAFYDDGKQINISTYGLAKPTILGLLYAFVQRFEREINGNR